MSKLTGSKKATQFTESVIREMTRLNHLHGGVNLSQGFPDFPAPQAIKDAACAAINADVNQYAVTWGARPLREAIAREFTKRYGLEIVADEQVTVCCGTTEAMMSTMMAIVDPLGRDAALRHPACAHVVVRSGRARGGVQRQDEGDHHQHAEQSDRQGVLA
jgi:aspartate/methionine/tyrosine aminotransferase